MRVQIIGLDGCSPQLIENWIEDLPTFRKFKDLGCLGISIPPIPAQTPVAWTTFMTGKNPGKHGIFSFAMREPGTYERRIIWPELVRSKNILEVLSKEGKRVGSINVPMTDYNEQRIRGFMIPGFLSREEGKILPKKVAETIWKTGNHEKIEGDLEVDTLKRVKSDPDLFFKRVNEITKEMMDIGLYLHEREKWDLFIIVFMGADRIHHFFWRDVDENHPDYKQSRYTHKVKDYYVRLDGITAEFLASSPKDTITILVSDHGFCPIHKEMIVNNYLKSFGMLKIKEGKIDLRGSKAVSYGFGDIWLNLKGREPKGIIKSGREYEETRRTLIENLEILRIDDERPIKKVMKREEIYQGPFVSNAPDLTICFNPGWQAARSPEIITEEKPNDRYVIDNPRWNGGHDGTHHPMDVPGILGFFGQGVEPNKEIRAYLYDVTPTILNMFKVSVPSDMDGKSLKILR